MCMPSLCHPSSNVSLPMVHNLSLCIRTSVLIEVDSASPRGWTETTVWSLEAFSILIALTLADSPWPYAAVSQCVSAPLLHRCSLSPHPDVGDLCCAIREIWAAAATLFKATLNYDTLPKRTNRRLHCWGAENSALPNMCSPWLFCVCEFGDPLPLEPHFPLFLPLVMRSCQSPSTNVGRSLLSTQIRAAFKSYFIIKDSHIHNMQLSIQRQRQTITTKKKSMPNTESTGIANFTQPALSNSKDQNWAPRQEIPIFKWKCGNPS